MEKQRTFDRQFQTLDKLYTYIVLYHKLHGTIDLFHLFHYQLILYFQNKHNSSLCSKYRLCHTIYLHKNSKAMTAIIDVLDFRSKPADMSDIRS